MSWLKEYKSSLKRTEVEEILDLILYRPLGFLIVKLVLPTKLTPNQLTLIALVFGLIAGIFYACGSSECLLWAALMYLMFNAFDCADGMLARIKHNGTPTGRIIDGVADYFSGIFVFTGIALGVIIPAGMPIWFWLIFAGGILSIVVHSVSVDYYRNRFIDIVSKKPVSLAEELQEFKEELASMKQRKCCPLSRTLLKTYINYMGVQKGVTGKQKTERYIIEHCYNEFYNINILLIRFWTFLGPTTQISSLIIFSLIGRVDLFFYWMLIPANLYYLILKIVQLYTDKQIKKCLPSQP